MRNFSLTLRTALCVLLLALLPGCQIWNAYLDMLKWRMADDDKAKAAAALTTQSPGEHPAAAIVPRVTVYRITAPVGTFSTNDKVWSQLNEDALDSKTSVLMAQNGLRAGTAPVARWPLIAKLIDGPGVTTDQSICQTDGRSSLNVVTRAGVTDEIVVSIDRDLQQQGRSFERCDNGFKLSMRGIKGKQQLLVELEPVVTLGTVSVVRREGQMGVTSSGFISEERFSDLQMATALAPNQFLVVSPADPQKNRFSVGSLWLSDLDKVPSLETVLIFVPGTPSKQSP